MGKRGRGAIVFPLIALLACLWVTFGSFTPRPAYANSVPTATPTPWIGPYSLEVTVSYSGSATGLHPLVVEFRSTKQSPALVWRSIMSVDTFPASIHLDPTMIPTYTNCRAWWSVSGSLTAPGTGDPVSADIVLWWPWPVTLALQ